MRYLKNVIKLIGVVGFIVVIGAFDYADFQDTIGNYCSFGKLLITEFVGFAMMTPAVLMTMGECKNGK